MRTKDLKYLEWNMEARNSFKGAFFWKSQIGAAYHFWPVGLFFPNSHLIIEILKQPVYTRDLKIEEESAYGQESTGATRSVNNKIERASIVEAGSLDCPPL